MTKLQRQTQKPKPVSDQILILTPGDALLYDQKLRERAITLGKDKLKGSLQVIDLTGTLHTTYANMEAFTESEVTEAVMLDPGSYLPRELDANEMHLAALPTQNDDDKTAALIGYVPKTALAGLNDQLGTNPTYFTNALLVAASEYLNQDGDAILLQIDDDALTSLLIVGGKVRARARDLLSPNQMPEQATTFLGQTAGLSHNLTDIGLVGRPDYIQMVEQALAQDTSVRLKVFTPEELARTALHLPPLLNIRTQAIKKANPFLPLLLGAAAGLLPWLLLNTANQTTQANINRLKSQSEALGPQVQEAQRLKNNIDRIHDIQTKAQAIQQNRVDWYTSLDKIMGLLPEENGNYTVKFKSLSGKIINASAPASAASAPNGVTTSSTQGTQGTPAATTPSLTPPLVSYDMEMTAVSKYAATSLITNFEDRYNFNLAHLSRNVKTNTGWDMTANATEKESTSQPTQGSSQP